MNYFAYPGFDNRRKLLPITDVGKIQTILYIAKEVFNVDKWTRVKSKRKKRNPHSTAPERYISLIIAMELLGHNHNDLASLLEHKIGFPTRSSILHGINNYKAVLEVNTEFKENYRKIKELAQEKLK